LMAGSMLRNWWRWSGGMGLAGAVQVIVGLLIVKVGRDGIRHTNTRVAAEDGLWRAKN
jgi:hypothetical protein